MDIFSIYRNIDSKKIINNIYSKYWIYDIEEKITQGNNGFVKQLKVYFFDRNPNPNELLSQISIMVDGTLVPLKNIRRIDFNDDVLKMSCEIQFDATFSYQMLYIANYIINNEPIYLSESSYISGLSYHGDQSKMNVCKSLLQYDNFKISPEYDDVLWFCGCGYANVIDDTNCACCGASKEQMKLLADTSKEDLVLNEVTKRFSVDTKTPVEQKLNAFVNKVSNKYGVSKQMILAQFDLNQLKMKQEEMISQTILNYINSNSILWNVEKEFKDNIDDYIGKITSDVITNDKVKEKLDLTKLKSQYESMKVAYESKTKKQKIRKIVFAILGIILVVGIGLGGFMMMSNKPANEPSKDSSVIKNDENKDSNDIKEESVESSEKVNMIDKKVYEIDQKILSNSYMKIDYNDNTTLYYENGMLKLVEIVNEQNDKTKLYCHNDQLIYALFESNKNNELYFKDNALLLWREYLGEIECIPHENEDSDAYRNWESTALMKADIYLNDISVTKFVKNTTVPLNIRSQANHDSNLVGSLSSKKDIMYYFGDIETGKGSDGLDHNWYYIYTEEGLEGWVREDLVVLYDTNKPVGMDNILYIQSSSFLVEGDVLHTVDNLVDNKLATAWVEGAYGQGIDENLTVYFDEEYDVNGIIINSGYQKSETTYYNNSRPKEIEITFSNTSKMTVVLDDINAQQEIKFDESIRTSGIVITIKSVYPGDRYEDTCISELSFY